MRKLITSLLIIALQHGCCFTKSQTISQDILSQKMEMITDSIEAFVSIDDYEKVFSICKNGINFLSQNDCFTTPATCGLCLLAGESSMKLKNYQNAQTYFCQSFILDELGKFSIGAYSTILNYADSDTSICSFKNLIELAKTDTVYLNMLAKDPAKLSDMLNVTAWNYINNGDFIYAIKYFKSETSLLEILGQKGDDKYLSIIPCIIFCLKELHDFDLATAQADNFVELAKQYKGQKSIAYAKALQTRADVEDEFGNGEKAVELYNESLSLIESLKGKYNMEYINCLRQSGSAYETRDGNPFSFLKKELEAERLLSSTPDATLKDYVYNLNALSNLYATVGNKDSSLYYTQKAVELFELEGQTNNTLYASELATLCGALTNNHSYTKAIEIGKKSIEILSKISLKKNEIILLRQAASNLSHAHFEAGEIHKAIEILQPQVSEDYPDDQEKLTETQRLVTYCQRAGLRNLEKEYCDKSLKLAEKIGGKKSNLYANALCYISGIQEKKGDAIILLQEAANIFLELYGESSTHYAYTQNLLSLYKNNPQSHTDSQLDVLQNYKKLYGENSRYYLDAYRFYLLTNGRQHQEEENINALYQITIELDSLSQIIRASYSTNDELYMLARSNLAELFIGCYNMTLNSIFYGNGVEIQKEVVDIALSLYGKNNIKYIEEVERFVLLKSSQCDLYYTTHLDEIRKIYDLAANKTGDTSKAWKYYKSTSIAKCYKEIQELQKQVVDHYNKQKDRESSKYAYACKKLADYYSKEIATFPLDKFIIFTGKPLDTIRKSLDKKKNQAELLYQIALSIYNNNMNYHSASDVLESLHFLFDNTQNAEKSAQTLKEGFELWKNETIKQMSLMTSDEKSQMTLNWQPKIDYYNFRAYYKSGQDSALSLYSELSYDIQLLTKGLLLKSEIGLRDLILNTNNVNVIKEYNRLVDIKKQLSDTLNASSIRALKQEYQSLERHLMKESEVYGNYMQTFSYTFKDVQSSLNEGDVAIEFATTKDILRDGNGNFTRYRAYFALVVKPNYYSPKIIRLGNHFDSESIYQEVWEPLLDEIKGMKNVYFSPTYDLNKYPLESAKLPDGTFISDWGINFYRVSSTREIIRREKSKPFDSAILYGGLQYSAEIKDLIASDAEERSNGLRGVTSLEDNIESDLRGRKALWKYLAGTKEEVTQIKKIISDYGVKTKVFSASKGTESTFKNLSGKKISMIHLATHGFYIPPIDSTYDEDKMERSGLALSGANIILSGVNLPKGIDDGILTASEISSLDFRGLDLVVLSACETGLGDITGEGVYGLQRGFKKAGANSIIMSLWKVDDTSTMMLMTEFYNHLLHGCSKFEALKKAQMYVRKQKGYEDPEYWAGFILLDGIN